MVTVAVWATPFVSVPTCDFVLKIHSVPLRVLLISGSMAFFLFFSERDALTIVASTIVPCLSNYCLASKCAVTFANSFLVRLCRSSKSRNFRIVVSSGTSSWPSSMPTKLRIDSMS